MQEPGHTPLDGPDPGAGGTSELIWAGDHARLRVSGEVDLSNAHTVFESAATIEARSVTVDLSEVTFMDSSGLAALIEAMNGLSAVHVLVKAGSRVERLLEVSGLEEHLDFTLVE
ncbi:MAG: STAS domain-containing protein [Acidimicrobiia bacterium]